MKSRNKAISRKQLIWILLDAVLIGFLAWMRLHGFSMLGLKHANIVTILLEIIIHSALSFTLAYSLRSVITKNRSLYRTAFLSTIVIGATLLFLNVIIQAGRWSLGTFLMIILSSFLGSFLASSLELGWWENNAPPTPKIEQDVLAWHQAYIGSPIKKSSQKRILDILIALISLVVAAPLWLLVSFLIWWEDPGPIFFVKNSVGRGGVNFKQFKFRSMIIDAEKDTGPISGYENDERVLFFGKLLRKTALDELPQLANILLGDMSYVGPRPQRTVLVHGYLQQLPDYAHRHLVRPGLAGLAQVVDRYDISPKEKLAWDLIYIEHANIWLDIKLALAAFYLVFALRWQSDTNPEMIIRKLLNFSKPESS
ncbi:MAG: sugar transferase [Chloroflexota bacterium]|nr:sugar transferase [Chloroflexota bacterium]